MTRTIANALGYQVVWFAAVLGAAAGSAWPGIATAAAFVALQPAGPRGRRADAHLVVAALVAGIVLDGGLSAAGLLDYSAHAPGWPAPAWILAVWAAFAATLERSLAFLQPRIVLAAVLGAVGGPLAYLGAARLGAVVVVDAATALPLLALGWAIVMPALVKLSARGRPVAAAAVPEAAR